MLHDYDVYCKVKMINIVVTIVKIKKPPKHNKTCSCVPLVVLQG